MRVSQQNLAETVGACTRKARALDPGTVGRKHEVVDEWDLPIVVSNLLPKRSKRAHGPGGRENVHSLELNPGIARRPGESK